MFGGSERSIRGSEWRLGELWRKIAEMGAESEVRRVGGNGFPQVSGLGGGVEVGLSPNGANACAAESGEAAGVDWSSAEIEESKSCRGGVRGGVISAGLS